MSVATIVLDLDDEVVERSGRLRGMVRVNVGEPLEIAGLDLTFGWRTVGRGDTDARTVRTTRLLEGSTLATGWTERSFEEDVPHAPLSYQGTLLKIEWVLTARLDRRGWLKFDVVEERAVVVV